MAGLMETSPDLPPGIVDAAVAAIATVRGTSMVKSDSRKIRTDLEM
jgi:hypothetical protein